MNNRAIIVSGGAAEEGLIRDTVREQEGCCVIGADKGVESLYRCGIRPHYIVGDFDSLPKEILDYYKNETSVPVREYLPVKDASDTEIAVRLAMTLGCGKMTILGATGGRIDHLWANVQTLLIPFRGGVDAVILDAQNRIRLIGGETRLRRSDAFGPYFSVFPLGGEVRDLSITGAKYPLEHHTLTAYGSLCVSNEYEDEEVTIRFPEGVVILMETRDRMDNISEK